MELENIKKYYDKVAKSYTENCESCKWNPGEITAKTIEKIGLKSGTVLDLGCADGVGSAPLFENPDFKVYGVDISEEMIKIASERYPFTEIKCHDLNAPLPFEE